MPTIVENKKQYDTNILLVVYSSRLGGRYECHRFREYNIDLDLETDADAFDFVFKNANSVYTSLFSKFDVVEIYLNDVGIMAGRVDTVTYYWEAGESYIRVSGRDLAATMIDNHALPTTLQNINPNQYIAEKCSTYGIPNTNIESMSLVDKYVVGVGESEMSIIAKMVDNENKKMWLDYKTFYVGDWAMDTQPTYTFTNGVPVDKMCIPILSFELEDDGDEVFSESIVYGGASSGENKVLGTSKNNWMISNGIKRRVVRSSQNNDGSDTYTANAEDDVRYGFDNSHRLEISVGTRKELIKPNTTAWVIDTITKTNAIFFIKKVTYTKNLSNGSITKITMVPSKKANDEMYAAQGSLNGGITGKAAWTFNELWANKKG